MTVHFTGITKHQAMEKLQLLIQRSAFGVCSALGSLMGISSTRVRLYFIYLSFVTLGSPVVIYLFMAFWLNIRRYFRPKNTVILE